MASLALLKTAAAANCALSPGRGPAHSAHGAAVPSVQTGRPGPRELPKSPGSPTWASVCLPAQLRLTCERPVLRLPHPGCLQSALVEPKALQLTTGRGTSSYILIDAAHPSPPHPPLWHFLIFSPQTSVYLCC